MTLGLSDSSSRTSTAAPRFSSSVTAAWYWGVNTCATPAHCVAGKGLLGGGAGLEQPQSIRRAVTKGVIRNRFIAKHLSRQPNRLGQAQHTVGPLEVGNGRREGLWSAGSVGASNGREKRERDPSIPGPVPVRVGRADKKPDVALPA